MAELGELDAMLRDSGFEFFVSKRVGAEPRLERDTFSGGVNLSARERNHKRLGDACRVYQVASVPGRLIVAPWVYELIQAGLGADADDRIDRMHTQWHLTGRGRVAMDWKIDVADRMRAGQMSRYFWKRNPPSNITVDKEAWLRGLRPQPKPPEEGDKGE